MTFESQLVGMTRFELATPRPPDVCATGLRYIPNFTKQSHFRGMRYSRYWGVRYILKKSYTQHPVSSIQYYILNLGCKYRS